MHNSVITDIQQMYLATGITPIREPGPFKLQPKTS